jgi:hypothetical protein
MGGLNLMDPSAERVVYEKSANQPQPHLPSSPARLQRKKKQLDNNITLPAKSIQTFSPLLSKIELHSFLLTYQIPPPSHTQKFEITITAKSSLLYCKK